MALSTKSRDILKGYGFAVSDHAATSMDVSITRGVKCWNVFANGSGHRAFKNLDDAARHGVAMQRIASAAKIASETVCDSCGYLTTALGHANTCN